MGAWFSALGQISLFIAPWALRRVLLRFLFGFDLHPTARIGASVILSRRLTMGAYARIGSLSFIRGLERLELEEHSHLGNLNWISAFPLNTGASHYREEVGRDPSLVMRQHSAITNRHLIDCTGGVSIGEFSTIAGFRSQILTHSINIVDSVQRSAPVSIGRYSFVGTGVVILGGSILPDYSVLGAGSVLNKVFVDAFRLYAGSPAVMKRELDSGAAYFCRQRGFVV
jgi:acetyltransferase-like isoleucine patch superfamily enzyme